MIRSGKTGELEVQSTCSISSASVICRHTLTTAWREARGGEGARCVGRKGRMPHRPLTWCMARCSRRACQILTSTRQRTRFSKLTWFSSPALCAAELLQIFCWISTCHTVHAHRRESAAMVAIQKGSGARQLDLAAQRGDCTFMSTQRAPLW